jgi:hypothetical protein
MDIMELANLKTLHADDFCTVCSAEDIESNRLVSVRIFKNTLATNTLFREHFERVTAAMTNQKLGHNIVIKDALITSNHCKIITEFFDPPALTTTERLPGMSEETVIKIGLQIASSRRVDRILPMMPFPFLDTFRVRLAARGYYVI